MNKTSKILRKVVKGSNVLLISIPKQIINKFKIKQGDTIMYEVTGDRIEIKKIELE